MQNKYCIRNWEFRRAPEKVWDRERREFKPILSLCPRSQENSAMTLEQRESHQVCVCEQESEINRESLFGFRVDDQFYLFTYRPPTLILLFLILVSLDYFLFIFWISIFFYDLSFERKILTYWNFSTVCPIHNLLHNLLVIKAS